MLSPLSSIYYEIASDLLGRSGDIETFQRKVTSVVESTSAYVLDDEASFDELEGCEKSIYGVKFEKRFVHEFGLPRKRSKYNELIDGSLILDTKIAGRNVDIKTTLGGKTWMVPREARDQFCLLLQVDYRQSVYHLGTLLMEGGFLTPGPNRDTKVSVSSDGKRKIAWMLQGVPFVYGMSPAYEPGMMSWV